MELRELLIDLIMSAVWIYSGIVLLLVKNKSCMCVKPYFTAKKYMVMFLLFSGIVTVISTIRVAVFGKELECFCIFDLSCSFVEAILLLLSVMSLFNHEGCMGRNLWRCFSPVFILVILYFGTKLVFEEPRVYSITELLRCIYQSPPVIIRLLIEFSIVTGVGVVVYKYFGYKKLCQSDPALLPIKHARIEWIDKMVVSMILLGGLSVLDSVITWELYSYINSIADTGGIIYYVISFINYQIEADTNVIVAENDNTETSILYPSENNDDGSVTGIAEYKEMSVEDPVLESDEENEVLNSLNEIDENYYYTKKAIVKWINRPEKPYLKGGITLREVALGVGVSRRRLSDFIKSEYNCNFNTWINTLRIEEVKRYLLEEDTNLSLSYIADQTGFSDLAGMSNTFKKVMGIPPSLFRKEIVTKTICEEMRG